MQNVIVLNYRETRRPGPDLRRRGAQTGKLAPKVLVRGAKLPNNKWMYRSLCNECRNTNYNFSLTWYFFFFTRLFLESNRYVSNGGITERAPTHDGTSFDEKYTRSGTGRRFDDNVGECLLSSVFFQFRLFRNYLTPGFPGILSGIRHRARCLRRIRSVKRTAHHRRWIKNKRVRRFVSIVRPPSHSARRNGRRNGLISEYRPTTPIGGRIFRTVTRGYRGRAGRTHLATGALGGGQRTTITHACRGIPLTRLARRTAV